MRRAILVTALLVCATSGPRAQTPIFTFETGFWINLHQFLYALGRAEAGFPDSKRRAVADAPRDATKIGTQAAADQQVWKAAVSFYQAGLSKSDAVFDKSLVQVTRVLADADNAASLDGRGLDAALRKVLEDTAPVYRRVWWPAHQAASQARISTLQDWLKKSGAAVRDRLTRLYGQRWAADGQKIEMSAYATWSGAYSTDGGLIVLSSLDTGNDGALGFETIFHEALHQWDDAAWAMVRDEARRQGVHVPNQITHAMIFYTAGDAVGRSVPGHVPYAEANGLWNGPPFGVFHKILQRAWQPFLDGTTTRAEALKALVEGTAVAGTSKPAVATITDLERQRLVAHLQVTASWLLDEVTGLTTAQLDFHPSADAWNIMQVLDHLIVVGPIYWQDLQKAMNTPPSGRGNISTDADILWYGIDRTRRETAIPTEIPKGRVGDLRGALDAYRKQHLQLLEYARTTTDDLRRHYVERQGCDAYQWALLISTHEQRHILQIREIKAHAKFPKK